MPISPEACCKILVPDILTFGLPLPALPVRLSSHNSNIIPPLFPMTHPPLLTNRRISPASPLHLLFCLSGSKKASVLMFSFLSMCERPQRSGQQGSSPSLLIVHVKGQTLGAEGECGLRVHTHQSYANTRHFRPKRCSLNITQQLYCSVLVLRP